MIPKSLILLFTTSILIGSCTLLGAAGLTSQGQPTKTTPQQLTSTTANSVINVDHAAWDKILKTYVDANGDVDYKSLKDNREELQKYLKYLSGMQPNDDWSVQELLAFYINLYNAYTVDLIVENYPVKSIKDISGAWTKAIVPIGNRTLSLGGIENGVLRKMNEPRIHFAINCASVSCPKLLNEAYTAGKINEQLDKATREFINSEKNQISENSLKLSSIFDWYKGDYLINGNESVIDFINPYTDIEISKNATIDYLDYNWNLNE